jgi:hypothetical protein
MKEIQARMASGSKPHNSRVTLKGLMADGERHKTGETIE